MEHRGSMDFDPIRVGGLEGFHLACCVSWMTVYVCVWLCTRVKLGHKLNPRSRTSEWSSWVQSTETNSFIMPNFEIGPVTKINYFAITMAPGYTNLQISISEGRICLAQPRPSLAQNRQCSVRKQPMHFVGHWHLNKFKFGKASQTAVNLTGPVPFSSMCIDFNLSAFSNKAGFMSSLLHDCRCNWLSCIEDICTNLSGEEMLMATLNGTVWANFAPWSCGVGAVNLINEYIQNRHNVKPNVCWHVNDE